MNYTFSEQLKVIRKTCSCLRFPSELCTERAGGDFQTFRFLFIGVTLEVVNHDKQALQSNKRGLFKRDSDTALCKYGEGSSKADRQAGGAGVCVCVWEDHRRYFVESICVRRRM